MNTDLDDPGLYSQESVIPAHPGWILLKPKMDQKGDVVGMTGFPVIAWRIGRCGDSSHEFEYVDPVTPMEPPQTEGYTRFYRMPDGVVIDPEDSSVLTDAQIISAWQETRELRRNDEIGAIRMAEKLIESLRRPSPSQA